jgi:F-type H+-transporting ATPase subunit b
MSVDWLTTGAQIVNFLILVYLLKRFLYRPIVGAMTRREASIAARVHEAEERSAAAAAAAAEFETRSRALAAEAESVRGQAREAADGERRRLLSEARAEAAESRARWRTELAREQADHARRVREVLSAQALAIARKLLAELADARLEAEVVRRFVGELEGSGARIREDLAAAARAGRPMVLASAFPLPEPERSELAGALARIAGGEVRLDHTVDPGLVCGLSLEAAGERFRFSLDSELDAVGTALAEALGGEDGGPPREASDRDA